MRCNCKICKAYDIQKEETIGDGIRGKVKDNTMEFTWKTADKLSVRVLEEERRCETRQKREQPASLTWDHKLLMPPRSLKRHDGEKHVDGVGGRPVASVIQTVASVRHNSTRRKVRRGH